MGNKSEKKENFVRNDADKKRHSPFSLLKSFSCAQEGLSYNFFSQRNMRIHLLIALIVIICGFVFNLDLGSWAAVLICIGLVIGGECMNTAIESLVDLVSPEYQLLAKRAKDSAAAAILVFAVMSVVVGLIVFLPRVIAILS
ncbi:MAG: diacylglycerol kinase family protein [Eggerthellaceae bacterium]|jgi:diacylglycerol kinase